MQFVLHVTFAVAAGIAALTAALGLLAAFIWALMDATSRITKSEYAKYSDFSMPINAFVFSGLAGAAAALLAVVAFSLRTL